VCLRALGLQRFLLLIYADNRGTLKTSEWHPFRELALNHHFSGKERKLGEKSPNHTLEMPISTECRKDIASSLPLIADSALQCI